MIFVDTGAWYARHVPTDPDHLRAKAWFDANRQLLVTTDYCLDEIVTLLAVRGHLQRAMHLGRALLEERIARLHLITAEQIAKAWILFEQRAGAGWSFTNCTSKVVLADLGIRAAVALDDHFRQFGNVLVLP